ncbi:MAG TPA: hypothetical protein VE820_02520 [Sphingomicrobium sp.]|nr:hypothetical protein [Sphingomicrobium sp.]
MSRYTPDPKAGWALPLNDKVSRIAHSLASLARLPFGGDRRPSEDRLELSEEAVNHALRAWRERAFYFPEAIFFDPAWGMLLELLHAEVMRRPLTVPELCKLSRASVASAARWLRVLEEQELVVRLPDPAHPRRELAALSPKASAALRQYFHDVLHR